MKISGEIIRIDAIPIDAAGNKLEPEECPATEAFGTPVEVTLADHAVRPGDATHEETQGSLRAIVGIESTAGDVAQSTATRCELCEHWHHDDWEKHLAAIQDTIEGRQQIDALRGELLGQHDMAEIDDTDIIVVTIAVRREFGICAAFTETENDVVATPFYGGCPETDARFKMRDADAQRLASAGYDKILKLAQGKKE